MIEKIIFLIWLICVMGWNYLWPTATPFQDVFVAVCLALFSRSLNRNLNYSDQLKHIQSLG